jgi:DNA replication protein DnaC
MDILKQNLEYLRLPYIRDNFEQSAVEAEKKKMTHVDFLAELVEEEASLRRENAVKRRILQAKFPYVKTLEGFKWSHPEKINRQQITNLMTGKFIERKENVIFMGGPGLGKSHLSLAIGENACRIGYSVLFFPAVDIINHLTAAKATYDLEKGLRKYSKPDLLLIDELGYLPIDKLGADLLFQVISRRYERSSTIITTNRSFKEWPEIFNNDSTVTSAVLDRVLHHCEVVVIEGSSFRMSDRNKAALQ